MIRVGAVKQQPPMVQKMWGSISVLQREGSAVIFEDLQAHYNVVTRLCAPLRCKKTHWWAAEGRRGGVLYRTAVRSGEAFSTQLCSFPVVKYISGG